jgi:hypothetical protein
MIETDEHMQVAQQAAANLKNVLPEARKVHSPQDYLRLSALILLEIQQREQEILGYVSSTEQRVASYRRT